MPCLYRQPDGWAEYQAYFNTGYPDGVLRVKLRDGSNGEASWIGGNGWPYTGGVSTFSLAISDDDHVRFYLDNTLLHDFGVVVGNPDDYYIGLYLYDLDSGLADLEPFEMEVQQRPHEKENGPNLLDLIMHTVNAAEKEAKKVSQPLR